MSGWDETASLLNEISLISPDGNLRFVCKKVFFFTYYYVFRKVNRRLVSKIMTVYTRLNITSRRPRFQTFPKKLIQNMYSTSLWL